MAVYTRLYSFVDDDSTLLTNWVTDGTWWISVDNEPCAPGLQAVPYDGVSDYISSAGTPNSGAPEVYRDLDVTAHSTEIDAGSVDYKFSAQIASYAGDSGSIAIEFYDSLSAIIGTRQSGTLVDPKCDWAEQELTGTIPVGAETVRMIVIATHGAGTYNNAYFHDPSLWVTGVDIGEELRSSQIVSEAVVERDADSEVRLSSMGAEAVTEITHTGEIRLSGMLMEAVIERRAQVINHNEPTSIMCFA